MLYLYTYYYCKILSGGAPFLYVTNEVPNLNGVQVFITTHENTWRPHDIPYTYPVLTINIDIGAKILKQKCFDCKTYFPDTFLGFDPRNKHEFVRRFWIWYSRGSRTHILRFLRKFACGLGFAAWRRRTTDDGRRQIHNIIKDIK